jgi:hypothetical protein
MFVKENIRTLCKGGVITVEQYRWEMLPLVNTALKVMKHHVEAKSVTFSDQRGRQGEKDRSIVC